MTLFSLKNKIFPLMVLLLATTLNSFSGLKKVIFLQKELSVSAKHTAPTEDKRTATEAPQSAEEQENDDKDDKAEDKTEDADDPFIIEHSIIEHIGNRVNHIYDCQISLYREHHRVILSPPPEA